MKRLVKDFNEFQDDDSIFCMSNLRGSKVKVPHNLPFSCYFSGKNTSHRIKVKPIFNPDRMLISKAGTLKLCDDWAYTPGEDDKTVSIKSIREMKQFFKDYIVIFVLVWDLHLSDPVAQDYFEGQISLHKLIEDLNFYLKYQDILDNVDSVQNLERICRKYNLVNFYGN